MAATLLAAELVSLTVYFVSTGGSIYYFSKEVDPAIAIEKTGHTIQRKTTPSQAAGKTSANPSDTEEQKETERKAERARSAQSPYFGYSYLPRMDISHAYFGENKPDVLLTNNYGFPEAFDYPYKPDKEQFTVGIFGGSVSLQIALTGERFLSSRLKEAGCEKPVILSFGQGGYKQPQSLLVLSYFFSIGQRLDAVVLIDGFNEVALTRSNKSAGWAAPMPSFQKMSMLIMSQNTLSSNPEVIATVAKVYENSKLSAEWAETSINTYSAAIHLAAGAMAKYYLAKRGELAWGFDKTITPLLKAEPNTGIIRAKENQSVEDFLAGAVDNWEQSSRMMSLIARANGAEFFHFVQPNQRFSKHTFSEEEKKVALSKTYPEYQEGVRIGYPLLMKGFKQLQAEGVTVYDATTIFDSTLEHVYWDSCCHYNEAGIEIFADYIAEKMSGACKKQKKADN